MPLVIWSDIVRTYRMLRMTSYMPLLTHVNMFVARIYPQAIQELFDELQSSKQSRLRAWQLLKKIRAALNEESAIQISPPAQKTFEGEGDRLTTALWNALRNRNAALRDPVMDTGIRYSKLSSYLVPAVASFQSLSGRIRSSLLVLGFGFGGFGGPVTPSRPSEERLNG